MTIAIISDTHFPGHGAALPQTCLMMIRAADLLVHAGDLADAATLRMLRAIGPPLVAVHGNADDDEVRAVLPATATAVAGGVRIGVVHNGGAEAGRLARLRRRFPDCAGVVFGHSHIPLHAVDADGFFILNPGSATDRRRQPRHSMALLDTPPQGGVSVRFVDLDADGAPLDPAFVRNAG